MLLVILTHPNENETHPTENFNRSVIPNYSIAKALRELDVNLHCRFVQPDFSLPGSPDFYPFLIELKYFEDSLRSVTASFT